MVLCRTVTSRKKGACLKHREDDFSGEILFKPMRLGDLVLRNRAVALPLFTGYAYPDGRVSPLLNEHYWRVAASGAAVVVVANVSVSEDGVTASHNLRIDRDEFIPGLSRLARVIRKQGAIPCIQLNHGGRFAKAEHPMLPSPIDGSYLIHDIAALKAFMEEFPLEERFGLSARLLEMALRWQRSMSDKDRARVVTDFGKAAYRASEAGFEMLELHGGTGYLLAEYLSAYTNRNPSGYGGSLRERAAFPLEVLSEVMRRLPARFPVGFRLLVREWVPEGIDIEEAVAFGQMLDQAGIAYVSATAGTYISLFKPDVMRTTARPCHLRKEAAALKRSLACPVAISGRVLTSRLANDVLQRGEADLIGLGRSLLADPMWLDKARTGERVTACINCYNCLKRVVLDQGVACVRWPKGRVERIDLERSLMLRSLSRVLIIAAREADLDLIRFSWRPVVPFRRDMSIRVLFFKTHSETSLSDTAIEEFLEWTRTQWGRYCDVVHTIRSVAVPSESMVMEEAQEGRFGVIVLGRDPEEPWRGRIAYRHKTGMVSLIGRHPNQTRNLVPVDLSPVSLLVLATLKHACFCRKDLHFRFVHVSKGGDGDARRQWEEILDLLDWDNEAEMELLPLKLGTVADILQEIRSGEYGQVIMGRRGRTAMKQWLLGSVSAGVMRGLGNQSINLIG